LLSCFARGALDRLLDLLHILLHLAAMPL
jgi:hypothetical protein